MIDLFFDLYFVYTYIRKMIILGNKYLMMNINNIKLEKIKKQSVLYLCNLYFYIYCTFLHYFKFCHKKKTSKIIYLC